MKNYILLLTFLLATFSDSDHIKGFVENYPSFHHIDDKDKPARLLTILPRTIIASAVGPGYDADNATDCFVAAIKSAKKGDTVLIDCKLGTDGVWNIEGRHPNWFDGERGRDKVANDLTIIFEEGVTLKSIDSTFEDESGLDMLFRLENLSGWKIYGYGAKFEMDEEKLPSGEAWNAIALYDCKDILIEGLSIDGSGGDGMYVGTRTQTGYCSNVIARNLSFTNHRRQGASITSADNVLFENVKFNYTSGRPPASGLDFEPNYRGQRLTNIRFENVEFARNGYTGILFALSRLNDTAIPIDVTFDGVYIWENWQEKGELNPKYKKTAIAMGFGGSGDDAVQGSVVFNNVLVKDEKFDGIFTLKHHDSYKLVFNDLVIKNVGNQNQGEAQNPIHISRYNYNSPTPAVGNISFKGLLIKDDRNLPFWKIEGDANDGWSIDDVIITDALIVNPFTKGATIDNTTNASKGQGTSLQFRRSITMPKSIVNLKINASEVRRGSKSAFTITRTTEDLGYPLSVEYKISGTAENMNDYDLLHGFVIIPANQRSVEIPINTRAKDEKDETLTLTLISTADYILGSSLSQTLKIVSEN